MWARLRFWLRRRYSQRARDAWRLGQLVQRDLDDMDGTGLTGETLTAAAAYKDRWADGKVDT